MLIPAARVRGVTSATASPRAVAKLNGVGTFPFAVSTTGCSDLAEPLSTALSAQWAFGFPIVPKPGLQLTHGFLHYPAGMQPASAAHLLEVLPQGLLLDPFVGGGTTLVEAMRTGRTVVGADVSPLALFTARHHTWQATDEQLASLRSRATEAIDAVGAGSPSGEATPATSDEGRTGTRKLERQGKGRGARGGTTFKSWEPLKAEIEALEASSMPAGDEGFQGGVAAALSPLWFCYAAAQQRAERYRYASVLASFDATVDGYIAALRDLRDALPPTPAPGTLLSPSGVHLYQADARQLSLEAAGLPLADAVLTSPPYAGVYDYLSHAREARARLGAQGAAPLMGLHGTPDGRSWPATWRSDREMGARKAMRKTRVPGEFREAWDSDQRAWLRAMRANLRPGGRAALFVGDGESAIDALDSTAEAAADAGMELLASATIRPTGDKGHQFRGKRRPEHILLLEAP